MPRIGQASQVPFTVVGSLPAAPSALGSAGFTVNTSTIDFWMNTFSSSEWVKISIQHNSLTTVLDKEGTMQHIDH